MKYLMNLSLAAVVAAAPALFLAACDRTVEEHTKTTTKDGQVEKERKTVTQDTNGNTTVTKEKTESSSDR